MYGTGRYKRAFHVNISGTYTGSWSEFRWSWDSME